MGCTCASAATSEARAPDIRAIYSIGNVLGSGAFGQVRGCVHRGTKEQFAVKIMAKCPPAKGNQPRQNNVDFAEMFLNEVAILRDLDHRNVIRCHEYYEDKHFLYAIIDKCEGGELYQKISSKKCLFESDASRICRQMLQSVSYLHSKGIVHRDIKAQNFLFKSKDSMSDLVLIDFGMATRLDSDSEYLTRLCGSPHYVSPELVSRKYRHSVDIWAVGVVMYLMTYGKYPFEGPDKSSIMKKVTWATPIIESGPSPLLVDFLKGLLHKDPIKRLSAQEALEHPWTASNHKKNTVVVPQEVVQEMRRRLTLEKDSELEKAIDRRLTELDVQYQDRVSSRKFSKGLSSERASVSEIPTT